MSAAPPASSLLTRRALLALAAGASVGARRVRAQPVPAVHVRTAGEGPRAWVLLHPFSASGRFWEARAASLAVEHRVRVISPDLPSHGQSAIVDYFNYDVASRAIGDVLAPHRDAIDLVVGASSGGIVALKYGATLSCPVVAIGVGASFSAANIADMTARSRAAGVPDPFTAAFLEQGDAQAMALARHFGDLARLGQQPLITSAEATALAGRTLILNGADDTFFGVESAHALARAIPRSTLMFMSGAGHLDPLGPERRAVTWATTAAFAAAARTR